MHCIKVIYNYNTTEISCNDGENLSEVLIKNGFPASRPCGGTGRCGKCRVTVNNEAVLACRYIIRSDITVSLPDEREYLSSEDGISCENATDNVCLVLDIGTTTLAMSLVSYNNKAVLGTITVVNPQCAYGADVIARTEYCRRHGVKALQTAVIDAINTMIERLLSPHGTEKVGRLFVTGNTTMLHLFLGIDCSSMGTYPYTPVFLESKRMSAQTLRISRASEIISLPCISAFTGADIVSGLLTAQLPGKNRYNMLIDLGTNAETVLFTNDRFICTAAAAGPCFEGAEISCGTSAVRGAICSYTYGKPPVTIGDAEPSGICATGLIDIIAQLLINDIIEESGTMYRESYEICDNIRITQEDIRKFQLAKAAVSAAVKTLIKKAGITFRDIDSIYVSGGFSDKLNFDNAIITGLLPLEGKGKFISAGNSALSGAVKYALDNEDTAFITDNAQYIDLSEDEYFRSLFIKNMSFSI